MSSCASLALFSIHRWRRDCTVHWVCRELEYVLRTRLLCNITASAALSRARCASALLSLGEEGRYQRSAVFYCITWRLFEVFSIVQSKDRVFVSPPNSFSWVYWPYTQGRCEDQTASERICHRHGRRLGAEFGGKENKFRAPKFRMTFFRKNFPFSRRKFLMTFL